MTGKAKKGTNPLKSGTVLIIFVVEIPVLFGVDRQLWTQNIMSISLQKNVGTVSLFNGFVLFFTCRSLFKCCVTSTLAYE